MAKIDEEIKSSFVDNKYRLLANVVFTRNWIQNQFASFLKPFGVSPQQFNILRILRGANDWLNMHEVKSRMVEKSPNATRLCDKLVEKQLVERARSEEDRRVVHLRITKAGLDLLVKIGEKDDKSSINFVENISDEEAKIASEILDKFRG
ncbi:MarR family transcriptional regulator [uncultured Microscilla sp.]|uniref:MarR family winged helix-turn-helix transcriptional regulator n=1 Tax=uncultured Microscilla sp. TaxID=432653 RepID=UPI00260636FF|nr:MarR family transcriptional regulator [uncultured Microscilla sp.]